MRKLLVLSLALFLLLGLGMSFALQPVDAHKDHKHENGVCHSEEIVKPLASSCAYCNGPLTYTYSKAATCTTSGYKRNACPDCGYYVTVATYPATGHDWYQIPGTFTYRCYYCGATTP